MIEHFGWEHYRFHVSSWEIQEQIEVWKARLAGQSEQNEAYIRELGN